MVAARAGPPELGSTIVGLRRDCSKTGCTGPAVATLTYAYADRAVVLGPLATYAEPHTYDLCRAHAERLTAPKGWEAVRVGGEWSEPAAASDDLLAVVDAVRERGPSTTRRSSEAAAAHGAGTPLPTAAPAEAAAGLARRRGHLRILRDT